MKSYGFIVGYYENFVLASVEKNFSTVLLLKKSFSQLNRAVQDRASCIANEIFISLPILCTMSEWILLGMTRSSIFNLFWSNSG